MSIFCTPWIAQAAMHRDLIPAHMSPAAQVQTHLCVLKQLPAAQQYLDRCYTALPHPVPATAHCVYAHASHVT